MCQDEFKTPAVFGLRQSLGTLSRPVAVGGAEVGGVSRNIALEVTGSTLEDSAEPGSLVLRNLLQ